MDKKPNKIASAGNIEVPAYLTLIDLGYEVDRSKIGTDQREEIWYARTNEHSFSASGPLELLGLHAMRQSRGEDWKAKDDEIDQFIEQFYPTEQDT